MRETPSIDFGPPRVDELDALNAVLEQALTFGVGSMAPWIEMIGHGNARAVRVGGRVVAGLSVIPMGHYIGGEVVPAGGVTAVGVAPDQRGTGVGLAMIRRMLQEQREMGLPISTLYPATTAFYRRAGYERAAQRIIYEVPLAMMNLRDYTLEALPADPGQYDAIKQLYARQAARSSTFIDRPDFYWSRFLDPKEKPSYKFVVRRDGVPEGYVVFAHATWGEPLNVRDIVALTPGAGRRILTLLADHRSMLETVRFPGGSNDTLLFLMPEQKQKVFQSLDLMLRVLDVQAALSARGYAPGLSAELHLEVVDDLFPDNNGHFVLRVEGGRGQVETGGHGRLRMHVRDLAALYTGYYTPFELCQVGQLTGDDAELATAATIFAGPRPWLPDMF